MPVPLAGQPDSTPSLGNGREVELKVKGSRFLAQAFSAEDEDTARRQLDAIRRQYHDATHHCWALRLQPADRPLELAEDDGEPSGTAGLPILQALQRAKLYDALVVVTRYFGGTKLGRGGLVRAYGEAARQAVEAAPRRTIWHDVTLGVDCSFDELGAVEAVLARHHADIRRIERDYSSGVHLELHLRRGAALPVAEELREITAGRARLNWG